MVPISAGFRYDFSHVWGGGAADPFISAHFGSGGYYYKDSLGANLRWWTFMFDVGAGVDLWVGDFVGVGLAYWFEYYNNIDDVSINALALQFTL